MRKRTFRATANERILIHLLDHTRETEKAKHPLDITQTGVAEVLRTRRSHISLAMSSLKGRELVEEKMGRVDGGTRKRKVYFLTHKGYARAIDLRDEFLKREITLVWNGKRERLTIGEVGTYLEEKQSLAALLSCIDREGVLNPADLEVPSEVEDSEEQRPPDRELPQEHHGLGLAPSGGEEAFQHSSDDPGERRLRMGIFSSGVVLTSLLMITPLLSSFFVLILWVPGMLASLGLFAYSFYGMREVNDDEKTFLISGSTFLVLWATLMIQLGLGGVPPWEAVLLLLLISISIPAIYRFLRDVRERMKREFPVAVGVFFVATGLSVLTLPAGSEWGRYLIPYLLTIGFASMLIAHTTRKFGFFAPQAFCLGMGLALLMTSVSWIYFYVSIFSYVGLLPSLLWLLLALYLVRIRILPEERAKKAIDTLEVVTPFSIGLFFTIFGIALLVAPRLIESLVMLTIGVPLTVYGLEKPVEVSRGKKIAFFVFSTVLTLATVYPILYA